MQRLTFKCCKACQENKPLTSFGPWKSNKVDGRFHYCRACVNTRKRAYTIRNAESINKDRRVRHAEKKLGIGTSIGRNVRSSEVFLEAMFSNCVRANTCLLWQGPVNRKGYAIGFLTGYSTRFLHRIVYCVVKNVSSSHIKGYEICHKCDIPNCIEPTHLFKGTTMDNSDDKVAKNRHLQKLKVTDVNAIRDIIGTTSLSAIAKRYNVSWALIRDIREGKKHAKTDRIVSPFEDLPTFRFSRRWYQEHGGLV